MTQLISQSIWPTIIDNIIISENNDDMRNRRVSVYVCIMAQESIFSSRMRDTEENENMQSVRQHSILLISRGSLE